MEVFIKILQLVLALSLLVFVHELGHYFTARLFKIRVEKFYLFFDVGGFSLFKFKVGETTFGVGWLPLGGYCKISGMIDESMDTEALKKPAQPWEFRSKPAWQRLIVMVGGVTMNLIAAIVIYVGMSWTWGESYIDNRDLKWGYSFNELGHEVGFRDGDHIVSFDGEPVEGSVNNVYLNMVIGQVRAVGVMRDGAPVTVAIPEGFTAQMLNSPEFMIPRVPFVIRDIPAETVTPLLAGDSLVAINGESVAFVGEIRRTLAAMAKEMSNVDAEVTVARDSAGVQVLRTLPVSVMPGGQLGIFIKSDISEWFPVRTLEYSFAEAVPAGFQKAGDQISGYWRQLKMLVNPKTEAYKGVGSFITIGNLFPGQWDWFSFWYWTAFLSIILAVLNILPIPALDGGHVVFLLWEVVTRRKPSDKFLEYAQLVGMIVLGALIVLAFWNDIYRFFIK
jgi:regulator of sigma E protease